MESSGFEEAKAETFSDAESPEPFDEKEGSEAGAIDSGTGLPLAAVSNDRYIDAGEDKFVRGSLYSQAGEDAYDEALEASESCERVSLIESWRELAESPESQCVERVSLIESVRELAESPESQYVRSSEENCLRLVESDQSEDEASELVLGILDVAALDASGVRCGEIEIIIVVNTDMIMKPVRQDVVKPICQPFLSYYRQNFLWPRVDLFTRSLFREELALQNDDTKDCIHRESFMDDLASQSDDTKDYPLRESFGDFLFNAVNKAILELEDTASSEAAPLVQFRRYYQEHFRMPIMMTSLARCLFQNTAVEDKSTTPLSLMQDELVELRCESDSSASSPECLLHNVALELVDKVCDYGPFVDALSAATSTDMECDLASEADIVLSGLIAGAVDGCLDTVSADSGERAETVASHDFDSSLQAEVRNCLLSSLADGSLELSIDDILGRLGQGAGHVQNLSLRSKLRHSLCASIENGSLEKAFDDVKQSRINAAHETAVKVQKTLLMAIEDNSLEDTLRFLYENDNSLGDKFLGPTADDELSLQETVRRTLISSAENGTLHHEMLHIAADISLPDMVRNGLLVAEENGSLQRAITSLCPSSNTLEAAQAKARSNLLLAWKSGKLDDVLAYAKGKSSDAQVESKQALETSSQKSPPFAAYYGSNFSGSRICEDLARESFDGQAGNRSVISQSTALEVEESQKADVEMKAANLIQNKERQRIAKAKVEQRRQERRDSIIVDVTNWALDKIADAAIKKALQASGKDAFTGTIVDRVVARCSIVAEGRNEVKLAAEAERNAATTFTRRSLQQACLRSEGRAKRSGSCLAQDVVGNIEDDIVKSELRSRPTDIQSELYEAQANQMHSSLKEVGLSPDKTSAESARAEIETCTQRSRGMSEPEGTLQSRICTPTTVASKELASALAEELCCAICVSGDFEAVISAPILFALENNLTIDDLTSTSQSAPIPETRIEVATHLDREDAVYGEYLDSPGDDPKRAFRNHPHTSQLYNADQARDFDWASSISPETEDYSWELPERANLLYSKSLWEERIVRAVMQGGPSSSISSSRSKSSPRRYHRASPGYSVSMHRCKHEAIVSSQVLYGINPSSCDASTDVPSILASHLSSHQSVADPMLPDESKTESIEFPGPGIETHDMGSPGVSLGSATDLVPRRPAVSSSGSSRPSRRYLQSQGSLAVGEVEAWSPLRGSSSSANWMPRAPSQPKTDEKKGTKSCRPVRRSAKSRWVIDFPVNRQNDAESMLCQTCEPTESVTDENDSAFLATLDSLRGGSAGTSKSGSAGTSKSMRPVRNRSRRPGVASEWTVWSNVPSRYRFAKGSSHLLLQKEGAEPAAESSEPAAENSAESPFKSGVPVSRVLPPVKTGALRFFTAHQERPVTTSVLHSSEYRKRMHENTRFFTLARCS